MIDFKEHAENKNSKTSKPEELCHLNMQQLREEHDKALNAAKENNTTETIEEIDKLHQTLEYNTGDVMEIGD